MHVGLTPKYKIVRENPSNSRDSLRRNRDIRQTEVRWATKVYAFHSSCQSNIEKHFVVEDSGKNDLARVIIASS